MVMDYLRSGYETFMQTWQDDTSLTRVRWFRAAPDAKFFAKEHLFGSQKTWDRERMNPPEYPGESGYAGWTNSANPLDYEGQDHCGSDNAMSQGGVHGVDPVITTLASGWAECCGEAPVVVCGWVVPARMRAAFVAGAGCSCGDGAEMQVQHLYLPTTWGGITADHWWFPVGMEFHPQAGGTAWDSTRPHYPLASCVDGARVVYWYPLWAINSTFCTVTSALQTYWHFEGNDTKVLRYASIAGSTVFTAGPPVTVQQITAVGQVDSICEFQPAPANEVFFDELP